MRTMRHAVVAGVEGYEEEVQEEEKGEGYVEDEGDLRPREGVRIVSVDLQPIAPLEGVRSLVADITHPTTIGRILEALESDEMGKGEEDREEKEEEEGQEVKDGESSRPVDLVISDGAPDVTGMHDLDIYVQSQLLFSALNVAIRVLKPGGNFVAKIFRGKDVDFIYAQMNCFFEQVTCAKPRSSRASSLEAFIVCQGFNLPTGFNVDDLLSPYGGEESNYPKPNVQKKGEAEGFIDGQRRTVREDGVTVLEFDADDDEVEQNRWIAPFVACGDLSAWDADATYHLPKDHVSLDPVRPPMNPPYKAALEERRRRGGFYGKTKK